MNRNTCKFVYIIPSTFTLSTIMGAKLERTDVRKTVADVPDRTKLSFYVSGTIADHHRNLGRVVKIETLLIFPICVRSSQTIGDVYDFQFSLVGKDWISQDFLKLPNSPLHAFSGRNLRFDVPCLFRYLVFSASNP